MSGYLVDQIDATAERGSLTSALESVYCHLAQTWMSPFPALRDKPADWRGYARRMQEMSERIDVPRAPHVHGGKWAAADLLSALNHVEILLRIGLALENEKWQLKRCGATHQHIADGEVAMPAKVADLEGKDDKGEPFALEAFGGPDYRNDSKLALDLNALRSSKKPRLLLAARKSALPSNLTTLLTASCEKRNGGPFKIEATIEKKRWEDDQILVIELTAITRETSRPKEFS